MGVATTDFHPLQQCTAWIALFPLYWCSLHFPLRQQVALLVSVHF